MVAPLTEVHSTIRSFYGSYSSLVLLHNGWIISEKMHNGYFTMIEGYMTPLLLFVVVCMVKKLLVKRLTKRFNLSRDNSRSIKNT